jgi:hypothetical protein
MMSRFLYTRHKRQPLSALTYQYYSTRESLIRFNSLVHPSYPSTSSPALVACYIVATVATDSGLASYYSS